MNKPLIETNPYLIDPTQREKLLYTSVCSSTAIEGVNVKFPLPNTATLYSGQVSLVKESEGFYGRRR